MDGKGVDTFDSLIYYAATKESASSILTHVRISMPIQVFSLPVRAQVSIERGTREGKTDIDMMVYTKYTR